MQSASNNKRGSGGCCAWRFDRVSNHSSKERALPRRGGQLCKRCDFGHQGAALQRKRPPSQQQQVLQQDQQTGTAQAAAQEPRRDVARQASPT
mmetsp:Transcript_313/g.1349  ORF Transcript_313/g.1349 Transcript_313/m.1349 type:complete len:93 (-) Transcript_313:344-622(-)